MVLTIKNKSQPRKKLQMIFDMANYAYHNCRDGRPNLENIDLLFDQYSEYIDIVGIADKSLYNRFNDNEKKRYKEKYLKTELIYETASFKDCADDYILIYSYYNNIYFSSNKRFQESKKVPYFFIESHRVPFLRIRDQIVLNFPESVKKVIQDLFERSYIVYEDYIEDTEKDLERTTLDVLEDIKNSNPDSDWDLYDN